MSKLTMNIESTLNKAQALLESQETLDDVQEVVQRALQAHELVVQSKLMVSRMTDSISKRGIRSLIRDHEKQVELTILRMMD